METLADIRQRWRAWRHASTNRAIFGAGLTIAVTTLLVNTAIVLKDIDVAWIFGVGDALDVFLMANLIPTFCISVLAGSLFTSFVPVYIGVNEAGGTVRAQQLLGTVTFLAIALFVVTAALLFVGDRWVIALIASRFVAAKQSRMVDVFDWLLPMILTGGLASFGGSVLNAQKRFALASLAPIFPPVMIVLVLVLSGNAPDPQLLVIGTLIGSVIHLAVVSWGLHKLGYSLFPRWHGIDEHSQRVITQYLPMIGGAFVMSATVVVNQIMAAWLPRGSVSALNFAGKVPTMINSLGAAAVGTAVLPFLSQQVARGDYAALKHTVRTYSRLILAVSIPVVVVALVFARPMIEVLFQRGAFQRHDTDLVSQILRCSVLQVPFYLLGTLFSRLVSVLRGNRVLLYGAIINVTISALMNLILMRFMDASGIALSTAIVYFFSTLFLYAYSSMAIRKRVSAG